MSKKARGRGGGGGRFSHTAYAEKLDREHEQLYESAGGFMADDGDSTAAGAKRRRADAGRRAQQPIELDEDDAGAAKYETGPNGFALCLVCAKEFPFSYLFDTFDYTVCDECRNVDTHPGHGLITRSEAKDDYLLKDEDLDMRKPLLKFLARKNPHNPNWGDMKLYLRAQIEQRCADVHGGVDEMRAKRESRAEQRRRAQNKRAEKKLAELRRAVKESQGGENSALQRAMAKSGRHEHSFGEEQYDDGADLYYTVCTGCHFRHAYEKL